MPKLNIANRPAADPETGWPAGMTGPAYRTPAYMTDPGELGAVQASRTRFDNIEPGISVREGMDRRNYEFFRPGEHIPRTKNGIILSANNIYRFNGVVHFVIDMMADFVTQGMQIYHPARAKQRRYRHWWKKVQGHLVSERLVNLLFRHGVAIPKRTYAVMDPEDVRDLERGVASRRSRKGADNEVDFQPSIDPGRNRIPGKYHFLNPVLVEAMGGALAAFAGTRTYGLKIPSEVVRAIKNPRDDHQRQLIGALPGYITSAVESNRDLIPLDREKVSILFYKKDDWDDWADPITLCVMKDIILYDKMKEADRAALDGSISRKTLWTLGLPEHKIQPGPASFRKLREQLLASSGGASQDLIWDATLKFQETNTNVHQFLGSTKYEPVLQAIFAGLGIPQSLAGGQGAQGGLTNNALSLKTLIERLTYARNVLVDFWEREFHQIQRAFGDRQPALLKFDLLTLSDEANVKQMWMNLWDRDLVSSETIMEQLGLLPEIETRRIKAEYQLREAGELPYKTGPFTEAAPHPEGLAKAAMQQGTIAPTEAGVKKKPKGRGDKSLLDHQAEQQDKTLDLQKQQMEADQELALKQQKIDQKQGADLHQQKLAQNDDLHQQRVSQKDAEHKAMLPVKKQAMRRQLQEKPRAKGQPGQGRPPGSKDAGPRKAKTVSPRVAKASLLGLQVFAREAQKVIAEVAHPAYLASLGKKNLRQLSVAEADHLESLKFAILGSLEPGSLPTPEHVTALLGHPPAPLPAFADELALLRDQVYGSRGRSPSSDEVRELQASAYASVHATTTPTDDDGDDTDGDA